MQTLVALGGFAGLAALIGSLSSLLRRTKRVEEQTVNNHGPNGQDVNLRDQIDQIQATMGIVVEELRSVNKKIDHTTGETHDRLESEAKERRQHEQDSAEAHRLIWHAINRSH